MASPPAPMAARRSGPGSEDEYPFKSRRLDPDVKSPPYDAPVGSHQSGSQQLSGSEQLVIFVNIWIPSPNRSGFQVYVVNLGLEFAGSRNNVKDLEPSIHIDGLKTDWPGCVVDTTLYVFEELDVFFKYDEEGNRITTGNTRVMGFDLSELSSYLNKGKKIEIGDFKSLTCMNYPKYRPVAVPTPDGKKILVFSSKIPLEEANEAFELYDPSYDTWTVLQPPEFSKASLDVIAYAFIDESRIGLESSQGLFVLHLDPEKKEVPLPDFSEIPVLGPNGVTIDDRVISAGCVSVMGTDSITSFPLSCPIVYSWRDPRPFITLLGRKHGGREAYTLVSHTGGEDPDLPVPRLLFIDACCTDLDSLETSIEGTLQYELGPGIPKVLAHMCTFII